MIYTNETDKKLILPRYLSNNDISVLVLRNNTTGAEFTYDLSEDVSTNKFFYEFNISLDSLFTGEYTYTLGSDKGMITVGNYIPTTKQYQYNTNRIQYDKN